MFMTGCVVLVMSRCHNKDILNIVIFALKMSLLSELHLMTVVLNMRKTWLWLWLWLWRCHVSLMHTPSSQVFPGQICTQ